MDCRISFTLVLTILTLILSLIPAVIIWVVFMDLMTSSVNLLKGTTQQSTDAMAERLQELLMEEAVNQFDTLLTEGENEIVAFAGMVRSSGLLSHDLRPSRFDLLSGAVNPYRGYTFSSMQGHLNLAILAISGAIFPTSIDVGTVGVRCFMSAVSAYYVNIPTGALGNRTLYWTASAMAADEGVINYDSWYIDQLTAMPVFPVLQQVITPPFPSMQMRYYPGGWDTQLAFDSLSGQAQLTRWDWLPAQNNTMVQVALAISPETLSAGLKQQLADSPNDRLVLFFRQPHGYMVASSNGKYWSDSDVDRRYINVLTHPMNVSAYRLWNCIQSNDALISEACQHIYAQYQSWTAIPAVRQEMVLGGQRYWVATDFSTSSSALRVTVLMLKNRAAVMGSIDAGNAHVDQTISDKKGVTFVVLGVISALAVLLPVAVGAWLASRLYRLAAGMDCIAKLQFHAASIRPTVFQELHRFQTSFIQMERGLQAFGKFVPQAVVKVLIGGQMKANDEMYPETLTIMFADIEGFSAICEEVPTEVLITVCTEYFEAICSNVVQRHGTIDKFIGDCIMALWNAPDRLPGHERDAVATSLAMQTSVMRLHNGWQQRGLPLLKFRLGLHTGGCLVGNFGCSYRVSYTCLGDSVNLAARLEALNKRFGTSFCVSGATYNACRADFHFRHLGKVTVPGKTEVLPVYELLCEAAAEAPTPRPRAADVPGAANGLCDISPSSSCNNLEYVRMQTLSPQVKYHPAGDSSIQVPYHWAEVDRSTLLQQAREYEEAYEALVAGDRGQAQQLLNSAALQGAPDKAWTALADQLRHTEASQPWDGVFRFREK